MRITELLKKESIELGVKVADKNAAIDKLISLMDAGGRLNSIQGYKAVSYTHLDVYKRQCHRNCPLSGHIPARKQGYRQSALLY